MVAINEYGKDVSFIFSELSEGYLPAEDIKNVLCCACVDVDNPDDLIIELINKYGIQECAVMARLLLTHAMIGDVKKLKMDRGEAVRLAMENFINTPSTSLKKVMSLWAGMCAASTALVCMIFSLLNLPTW